MGDEVVNGVQICSVSQANPNDIRGETWQWPQNNVVQLVICRRKAGSVSCHVHNGEDPSKNPEYLFIAQGKVKFTFVDKQNVRKEAIVEVGTTVTIRPNIIHRTEVIEDAVILESRCTVFDQSIPDTFLTNV